MNMYKKIKQYCEKYSMLEQDSRVVVGISGGPDSVCLLDFLYELKKERNLSIYAVHVHHGLREKTADQDERFTRELCKRYNIPYYCFYENVKERAIREKRSVEEAGRLCRYERMEQVRKETKSGYIAVAHHANDQAETVLFHLIRGSGVEGLKGMLPKREHIIRPFLNVTKQEILEQLQIRKLPYQIDETNAETTYTRNKIRNQWIPMMEQVNQEAVAHICETAKVMAMANDYIQKEREKAYNNCLMTEQREKDGTIQEIQFAIKRLKEQHPFLRLEVFKEMLSYLIGSGSIEKVHIEQINRLIEGETGKKLSLPKSYIAKKQYDTLIIEKKREEKNGTIQGYVYELEVPSSVYIEEIGIQITLSFVDSHKILKKWEDFDQRISKETYKKMFDYDKIRGRLQLRTRKAQDKLSIDESGKHKSLRRFFIDEKIPREQRERFPILADEEGILWLLGRRIGAKYKVDMTTKQILLVEYEKRTKETKNG